MHRERERTNSPEKDIYEIKYLDECKIKEV